MGLPGLIDDVYLHAPEGFTHERQDRFLVIALQGYARVTEPEDVALQLLDCVAVTAHTFARHCVGANDFAFSVLHDQYLQQYLPVGVLRPGVDSALRHQQVVEAYDRYLALRSLLVVLSNSASLDTLFAPRPVWVMPSRPVLVYLFLCRLVWIDRDTTRGALFFHILELDDLTNPVGLVEVIFILGTQDVNRTPRRIDDHVFRKPTDFKALL